MKIAALFILAIGLGAGATLYFLADEPPPAGYIIVGDTAYAYDPATSKTYVRQLERFGGKSAVLFDEFNRWFANLWIGRQLGLTIICLSAFTAFVLLWIARRR